MTTSDTEPVDSSSISIPLLPLARFSSDGFSIEDPLALLADLGVAQLPRLLAATPSIRSGGVHHAPVGAIQDPAGSAIGQPGRPSGGGASGAIYAAFPDLRPIPAIPPRAAVFNTSTGPGRRVLHTHSPRLAGRPSSALERSRVLSDLANSYANALVAFRRRVAALGPDAVVLNLAPVSASIYAGAFASPRYVNGHLDPSYTITAILVGLAHLDEHPVGPPGIDPPDLVLHYFAADVFAAANSLTERLKPTQSETFMSADSTPRVDPADMSGRVPSDPPVSDAQG